jgi:hypothetical protein
VAAAGQTLLLDCLVVVVVVAMAWVFLLALGEAELQTKVLLVAQVKIQAPHSLLAVAAALVRLAQMQLLGSEETAALVLHLQSQVLR